MRHTRFTTNRWLRGACAVLVCWSVHASTIIMLTEFENATGTRKWNWIQGAFDEFCSRNLRYWPGIALYPPMQNLPDSAVYCLKNIPMKDKPWGALWRTDIVVGGRYTIHGDRFDVELIFRQLGGNLVRDSIGLTGSIASVDTMSANIGREIAKHVGYDLQKDDLRRLYTAITTVPQAYATYAAGFSGFRKGNDDVAVYAMERAIEIDPLFAQAHHLLGLTNMRLGKTATAITNLYRAVELRPYETEFRVDLAYAYLQNQQDNLAEKVLESLKGTADNDELFLNLQGVIYMRQGLYQRAVARFLRAIAYNPSQLDYELNLGTAYYWSGDYQAAIAEFERMVRLVPQNNRYQVLLGIAYREAGYLKESIATLERVHEQDAHSIAALMNLAISYNQLKWYQQADYMLNRALELDSTRSELYSNKGVICLERGDTRGAVRYFDRALALDAKNTSAYNNQGVLCMMQQQWKDAKKNFKEAVAIGRKNPKILVNLAEACIRLGQEKKAADYLREAIFVEPFNLRARMLLAVISYVSGDREKAVQNIRDFLEVNPENDSAKISLGKILGDMNQEKEAIDLMESVVRKNPGNIDYALELAHLYRRIKWPDVALLKYQGILKQQPLNVQALWGMGATYILAAETKGGDPENYVNNARYYLKMALSADSSNADANYWMGILCLDYQQDKNCAQEHWGMFLKPGYKGAYAETVRERKKELRIKKN